jgi:predicted RNase H-like HicB family nuclease
VVRYSDEDQCYLAYAPALAGCTTHGSTAEDATRQGYEAVQLWLEDALAHGEHIPPPPRQASGKLTLRLPVSLHAKITEAAERDGISINQWIVTKLAHTL